MTEQGQSVQVYGAGPAMVEALVAAGHDRSQAEWLVQRLREEVLSDRPNRYQAQPDQIDSYLRRILLPDVYYRYQQSHRQRVADDLNRIPINGQAEAAEFARQVLQVAVEVAVDGLPERARPVPDPWPFDADESDPLTKLRIPVTSFQPEWSYLMAFDRDSEDRPTPAEVLQLRAFLGFIRSQLYPHTQHEMLTARPLDICGGHNTVVLHKWRTDDWGWRWVTHFGSPVFQPGPPWCRHPGIGSLTLEQALNVTQSIDGGQTVHPQWAMWKRAHPQAFPTIPNARQHD